MKKSETNEKKRIPYEQLWLRYFNDSLLEKGIITKKMIEAYEQGMQ